MGINIPLDPELCLLETKVSGSMNKYQVKLMFYVISPFGIHMDKSWFGSRQENDTCLLVWLHSINCKAWC